MSYSNTPPDLEEIIARAQAKHGRTGSGFSTEVAKVIFGIGMIILGGSILASALIIGSKIDKAQALIDRGVVVMEQIPAATDRMEKLLDRVDLSVQRGVKEVKDAVPKLPEGWLERTRNSLNKDPQ